MNDELLKTIEDLKRRVEQLEQRPIYYPVYVPIQQQPIPAPQPWGTGQPWYTGPVVTCCAGL